jgi:replication factor C small subunit
MSTDTDTEPQTTDSIASDVWVESYRPEKIEDIVGQNEITKQLQGYVDNGELPNLMFSGEPGIGKTTAAIAIAKEIYDESDWEENFLELNASDDRGIDVVRDRIKSFARSSFGGYEHRIIFLDESDSLTDDAQSALRRTIEKFSDNVRFILSCNYPGQIIDPIQSRCSVFNFQSINDADIQQHLEYIAEQENIPLTNDGVEAIVYAADGDMRSAVNALQGAAVLDGEINAEKVYHITNTPRPEEIESMIHQAINGEYVTAREQLLELINQRGLSGGEILTQIHRQIWNFDLPEPVIVDILDTIGETDYRITEGANTQVQLEALLASITKTNT